MKMTLEFDLTDEYEKKDAEIAMKASQLALVLSEVDNKLRGMLKYGSCDNENIRKTLDKEEVYNVVEYIREMINEEVHERGLGDLIY